MKTLIDRRLLTVLSVWTRTWSGEIEMHIGSNYFGSVIFGCCVLRKPYRICWYDNGKLNVKDFKTESGAIKALCHRVSRLNSPEVT